MFSPPTSSVEEWMIIYISEKLEKGEKITLAELERELVVKVLKMAKTIQNSFDNLVTLGNGFFKKKVVPYDSRLPSIIYSLKSIGIHSPDCDHIAKAGVYQRSSGNTVVFVTLDFKTILNNRLRIKNTENILCCDPLYAFHYLLA